MTFPCRVVINEWALGQFLNEKFPDFFVLLSFQGSLVYNTVISFSKASLVWESPFFSGLVCGTLRLLCHYNGLMHTINYILHSFTIRNLPNLDADAHDTR